MASEKGEPGFKRPRRWLWLRVTGWLAGTTLYWWRCVPAVPERVISLKPGQSLAGHTADGSLVLAMGGVVEMVTPHVFGEGEMTGPLEVVDPLSGELLNAVGNETWNLTSEVHGSNHVVFQSDDRREVVNLRTGRTELSRPLAADDHVDLSKDGRLLAVASRERVSMIAVETGESLWSREFPTDSKEYEGAEIADAYAIPTQYGPFTRIDFETRGLGTSLLHVQDGYGRDGLWVNSRTGETERSFNNVTHLVESPDRRYVLVDGKKSAELLSLTEGRVVSQIPVESQYCTFNQTSTEVRQLVMTPLGPQLARWSIPDGRVIREVAFDAENEAVDGCISEDGLTFVTAESNWGILGSSRLMEAVARFGSAPVLNFLIRNIESAVQRTADGHPFRILARTSTANDYFPSLIVTPIGKADCLAVMAPGRVLIFRVDPPRNWWWLAGWGLGPVVVIFVCAKLRSLRGRRPEFALVKESERHAQSA